MSLFSDRRISFYVFPIISGILCGLSILLFNTWLAWVMLVPLYYSLITVPKNSFIKGAISGSISGLIIFSWMISSARYYTGSSAYIGPSLWIISTVYFGLTVAVSAYIFSLITGNKTKGKNQWWIHSIVASVIWVLLDWLRTSITPGIPWFHYQFVVTQAQTNILLQIISVTGSKGLTFLIVFFNVLIAYTIFEKKYKHFWLPSLVFSGIVLFGAIRLSKSEIIKGNQIKTAIISENMDARMRWLPETGDSLAGIFFDLNRQAAEVNPKLIVWSETAIPWDIAADDDLVTKCLSITWPTRASHIIGIFTPSENQPGKRYNSAYYIRPDGAITSRYDKVQLLSFLEKPIMGSKLPFFNRSAHTDLIQANNRKLLKTDYGTAGVLICNETLERKPFIEALKLGADFFVVMSNNSWFEGSRLNYQHFYINRIRAVESGIDMVINCNKGISGIINSNGTIQVSGNSNEPQMLAGNLRMHKHKTFFARHNNWFIFVSVVFFLVYLFNERKAILVKKQ